MRLVFKGTLQMSTFTFALRFTYLQFWGFSRDWRRRIGGLESVESYLTGVQFVARPKTDSEPYHLLV